jgi:hypothetical protein
VRVEAAALEGINNWSLRHTILDTTVAGHEWITEVTILDDPEHTLFSCRLSVLSATGHVDNAAVSKLATPEIIRHFCEVVERNKLGTWLRPTVQTIGRDISVSAFINEITSPERWWNCHVISSYSNGKLSIDANTLHTRIKGCANTYILPERHELEFAAAVGYDFNLTPGGMRTFKSGFSVMSAEKTAHPAARAPSTSDDHLALQARVTQDSFRASVERPNVRFAAPSFSSIKQLVAEKNNELVRAVGDRAAQIEALQKLIKAEQRNAEEAVTLAIQSDEERQAAQDALANEQAINFSLRSRVAALESSLRDAGGTLETAEPQTYGDIKRWITENLPSTVRLTSRAERGLRDARYEKISDVIAGLRLLAGPYHQMKTGLSSAQEFETACSAHGFEETRSVSRVSAGRQGDDYFVVHAGRRQFLNRHLKKGTSKDPRNCLRIYFFWDTENDTVVIGSLPEHLGTATT